MRLEKTKIKLKSTSIEVWEEKCLCGSCDTIMVVADWGEENHEDFEHYATEGGFATKLDPYDQIRDLKRIIVELVMLYSITTDEPDKGAT